jgi:VanZ family protein
MMFLPAVLLTAGIAVLSLTESNHMPSVQMSDKIVHGLMYALLAVAWLAPLLRISRTRVIPYICVVFSVTVYGALLEILQRFCTLTRSGEMADLLADFLGALVGVILVALFEISRSRHLDVSK